ncbi:MAG: AcrR family transcriptional regulator [Kiritimatiellia bacterium]|jgi:AcrR family transcriptional regulator
MSSKKSLQQSQLDLTNTRIIEAAIELLQSRNVQAISFGELAKLAGVSRRTVYRHFEDRDALARGVMMHISPFDEAPSYGSVEDIWSLMPIFAKHLEEHPWYYRVMLGTPSRQGRDIHRIDQAQQDVICELSPQAKESFLAMMELLISPHAFDVLGSARKLPYQQTVPTIRWAMKVLREAAAEDPERLMREIEAGVDDEV